MNRRLLEIISPAGFEQFFAEVSARGPSGQLDEEEYPALLARYGLQVDPHSVSRLVQTHDLVIE
jgi:hypothetical protein